MPLCKSIASLHGRRELKLSRCGALLYPSGCYLLSQAWRKIVRNPPQNWIAPPPSPPPPSRWWFTEKSATMAGRCSPISIPNGASATPIPYEAAKAAWSQ